MIENKQNYIIVLKSGEVIYVKDVVITYTEDGVLKLDTGNGICGFNIEELVSYMPEYKEATDD